MPLKIVRNDIIRMQTEAIVNTASSDVAVGPGCDTRVYNAAGYEELFRYRKEHIGVVADTEAFLTPGFALPARYIIHAVSPMYMDGEEEENKLRVCYQNCLKLALENAISSVAFPLISTGNFGYPKEEGIRIAVEESNAFLLCHDMMIYLVVFDEEATEFGRKLQPDLESYINANYVKTAGQDTLYAASNCRPMHAQNTMAPVQKETGHAFAKPSFFKSFRRKDAHVLAEACDESLTAKKKECETAKEMVLSEEAAVLEDSVEEDYDFSEAHESKLAERMKHLSDTYSEYLLYLIEERGMDNAEVWKRGIVDKKVFSKIKNDSQYHPKKLTALCLCIGAKLNLDESKDLLARAGYALSPCDKTDVIFSYFIENGIYDMIELDIQLEEHGLPCIIS